MEQKPTLWEFICAFVQNWAALMTGAPTLPLAVWGGYFAPDEQKFWFFCLAAICLVIAAFFVWSKERIALNVAENKLAALDNPQFKGSIEQIFGCSSKESQATQIFILMSIRNFGSQSIAQGWLLSVHSDLINTTEPPTVIPDGFKIENQRPRVCVWCAALP